MTNEPDPTLRPAIVRAVATEHPELAFDLVAAHWDTFSHLMEPASQYRFVPELLAEGSDLKLLAKLDAFTDAHVPASARQDVRKAAATIRYARRHPPEPPPRGGTAGWPSTRAERGSRPPASEKNLVDFRPKL
ncbi:MAG: hypothetical protein WDM96_12270 [Lacunisphaera sp.]